MFIDKRTGTIELPNRMTINTEFNKTSFENSEYFCQATPYNFGTLPFQWYRLNGGLLDGHILGIRLCFYSETLVSFHAGFNFYPTHPARWEDHSFDIENQTKLFHDKILQEALGRPHKKTSGFGNGKYLGLDYSLVYKYKWGQVWSVYDQKGGSSSIIVKYGSRLEIAQNDYKKNFQNKTIASTKNAQ